MKLRWVILGIAVAAVILTWSALGFAYFNRPSLPIWAGIVTAAAVSLEALFWVAAGVFGWGFLAKRRAMPNPPAYSGCDLRPNRRSRKRPSAARLLAR